MGALDIALRPGQEVAHGLVAFGVFEQRCQAQHEQGQLVSCGIVASATHAKARTNSLKQLLSLIFF